MCATENDDDADTVGYVKFDLHVHSCFSSDSDSRIEDILRQAKNAGLRGIAITDHNEIEGSLRARKIARDFELIVVPGTEVSAKEGHILAYGIDGKIESGLSAKDTVKEIHAHGGIAVAAHPYRGISGIGPSVVRKSGFDAIEAINSRSPQKENLRAIDLAAELNIPSTGGSDCHDLECLGNAYIEFRDGMEKSEQIIQLIREGQGQPGGRGVTMTELVRYYCSVTTKWAKRGFKRI